MTGCFNFAQANRAPTPGEIACSDPTKPCSLDLFLTCETGLRGRLRTGASKVELAR